ncbi:MAG: type II toxin-antitoxin system RelE/ParE family toxin [Candidatus Marithrix sp.]
MELEFRKSFTKDLKRTNITTLKRLKILIEQLEIANSLEKIANVKKLKDIEEYYRIRIGDYRLGIKVEDNKLIILRFLHRKEIYRYFP